MLTDWPTVQAIMIARSVSEPRKYATSMAAASARTVLINKSGKRTVNDGPRRVAKICETRSLVDQLTPKSAVATCLRKMPSCTQYGWSTPRLRRMFSTCSALAILPARM